MKKRTYITLVILLGVTTTNVYATNGDNLIATGAKSRGMGGVGIAKSFGAESALANPSLLSSVENMEVSGSLTFFAPDVSFKSNSASQAIGEADPSYSDSGTKTSVIPEVSFAQRVNEHIVYGVSITGTASMGVDYSKDNLANGSLDMKTDLQLLKILIPISYQIENLSLGFAPVIQFGTLELSHIIDTSVPGVQPVAEDIIVLDNGASSDRSVGFELGMSYDMKDIDIKGLVVGMVYKSKIKMTYDNTLSDSIKSFGGAELTQIYSGDNLDQPAEFGFGASYTFNKHNIAFDYRLVTWADAAGFKDFGWKNQNTLALGYEYTTDIWSLRTGLNYAKSPVSEQDGSTYAGGIKNSFNLAGFPGIAETHLSFGGSYMLNDEVDLDFAVVYAPEVSESFDTSEVTRAFIEGAGNTYNNEKSTANVKHSQFSLTLGASYKF